MDEPQVRATAGVIHARSHEVAAAGNHWLVVGGDGGDDGDDDEPLDVRRITTPTLVVHGSGDPLFPLPHSEALAAAIPRSELLVLPGAGHEVPPRDTWDALVPVVLRHTSRQQVGRSERQLP